MPLTPLTDPDILAGHLSDESGLKGYADGVVRARDLQDVVDVVTACHARREPLLPVGCQTATTGAAVPMGGLVLDLRPLAGVVAVNERRRMAEVLPGTITMDLKEQVRQQGLIYPPDPTSEKECTIGGNVATNASGARTFRWGMTRDWLEGVEVVTGTGTVQRFFRRTVDKDTAGYGPFQDPVALFCGSEGTLGVITRVWTRLLPDPGPFVAFLLYLPTLDEALQLAVDFRLNQAPTAPPRCCELFDRAALHTISGHSRAPAIPTRAAAALYVEFDTLGEAIDQVIRRTVEPLQGHGVLLDDTVVAQSAAERDWVRELRHFVPESNNLEAARFHEAGGLKVSTEFCVPIQHLRTMMDIVEQTAQEASIDRIVRYGHVGNGHPHIFMRGRDAHEVTRLKALADTWYDKVATLGGTVAGEHGIGKTRVGILRHLYPDWYIEAMRAVRNTLDPHHILAPGNIFAR